MHEISVNDLLKLIGKKEEDFPFYYEYLDFFIGNEHIQNPNNHHMDSHKNRNHRDEKDFLKGNEVVYGDYLLYCCNGHDGDEYIYSYHSLNEIAEHIAYSYANPFTSDMKAVVNGKIKPFVVKAYDKFCNEYTHTKWGNDDDILWLERKWVEWLDEEKALSELEKEIQHDSPLIMLQSRFDWNKEDFLEFYKGLNKYDQTCFMKRLEREVKEINDTANEFKKSLEKEGE